MPRKARAIDPHAVPTRRQSDHARMAIKTSHIVRRLQANFDGQLEVPLSPSQLKSAELLLNRTLPVLSAMEVSQGTPPPEMGPEESYAKFTQLMVDRAGMVDEDTRQQLLEKLQKKPVLIEVSTEVKADAK